MARAVLTILAAILAALPAARAAEPLTGLGLRVQRVAGGHGALPSPDLPVPRPAEALSDGLPGIGGNDIAVAWLIGPTTRYGHGVLGDAVEAEGLRVVLADGRSLEYRLDAGSVFEDLRPRVADLDRDGRDEVIVVRSYLDTGAALAVFSVEGGRLVLRAETRPIGLANRWLNPVGAGDFTGDGALEVAYVQTPHIGGVLRVVSLRDGELVEEAALAGVSNHAIGSRALGLSAVLDLDGDGRDEVLVPAAGRRSLLIIRLEGDGLRELGRLDHDWPIVTDFQVADRNRDGLADVAYGLADGSVIEILR